MLAKTLIAVKGKQGNVANWILDQHPADDCLLLIPKQLFKVAYFRDCIFRTHRYYLLGVGRHYAWLLTSDNHSYAFMMSD